MNKKQLRSKEEVAKDFSEEEFIAYMKEKDVIQTRKVTAEELNCSTHTLRVMLAKLGITRKQGKPSRMIQFKKEK